MAALGPIRSRLILGSEMKVELPNNHSSFFISFSEKDFFVLTAKTDWSLDSKKEIIWYKYEY